MSRARARSILHQWFLQPPDYWLANRSTSGKVRYILYLLTYLQKCLCRLCPTLVSHAEYKATLVLIMVQQVPKRGRLPGGRIPPGVQRSKVGTKQELGHDTLARPYRWRVFFDMRRTTVMRTQLGTPHSGAPGRSFRPGVCGESGTQARRSSSTWVSLRGRAVFLLPRRGRKNYEGGMIPLACQPGSQVEQRRPLYQSRPGLTSSRAFELCKHGC